MKDRPIKQLLIIVRDNLKNCFSEKPIPCGGICAAIHSLRTDSELITCSEARELEKYLEDNKPLNAKTRILKYNEFAKDSIGYSLQRHWWTPREIEPRIKWLNKQIDKLK